MQYYCDKCRKTMDEANFYTYKNGEKTEKCKKCLTLHVDNFDPTTFLWLLEKMDVPYLEEEWNSLRDRAFAKDPRKMNGTSVFGKYLAKMRLKKWKDFHWADTEMLAEEKRLQEEQFVLQEAERERRDKALREKMETGEITKAQYKTLASTEFQNENIAAAVTVAEGTTNPFQSENFIPEEEMIDPSADLTKEDKLFLAMKWGRLYQPAEWVQLEQKYTEMKNSFDIQDSDTEGTLILTCKTFLKMNQAIDCGDIDGYNKLSRTYESLRKSGNFTAVQNKEEKSNVVNCIGEIVAYCEQNGGEIPRHEITVPKDIVDKVIFDLKKYYDGLIKEDAALSRQIEEYLQRRVNAEEIKKDKDRARAEGKSLVEISDQDHMDYLEMIQSQSEETEEIISEQKQTLEV